jgi:hypothetical protein
VHGAHRHGGGLEAQGEAIVPAHLLRSARGADRVLSDVKVTLLATTAPDQPVPGRLAMPRRHHHGAAVVG